MRKVEILEEELLIVKQALDLYKDTIIDRSETEIVNKILYEIKDVFSKPVDQ